MALAIVASGSTASALTFTTSGFAGSNTNYTIELNRAEDFSSDDTIIAAQTNTNGTGPQTVTVGGLPSGTPWFARAVESGSTVYSPSAFTSTQPVTLSSTYAGLTLDKALLVVPEHIFGLAAAANTTPLAGYPVTNMLLESPAASARFPGTAASFTFQTAGTPIDTFALLGTLLNDDATWAITAYSDAARTAAVYSSGSMQARCSATLGRRQSYHAFFVLPAPVSAPYWRIDVAAPGAVMMLIRNLIVGLARRSTNPNKGWTHGMNDQGTASRTRFGDPDRVFGWRGRTVDFELSWLTEAEYQTKWARLPVEVGKTRSVLAVPNSKRNVWLNDRIAYGNITDWKGENLQSSRFSASIAIDSIY